MEPRSRLRRLTWWTIAVGNVSFDPKNVRLERRPMHLQLILNFSLEPLNKNVRYFLNPTMSLQIGDPRFQSYFPVHEYTGHSQADNTEGAHCPNECCTPRRST